MASDLGTLGYCIPKLTESRAHQSASLVPLCFYNQSAHRGVIRVYISMGDRRGKKFPRKREERRGREKKELEE